MGGPKGMIDMDALLWQSMKENQDLKEELIGVLWDLISQADEKEIGDVVFYGHMFRSDLEYAVDRLVQLGQAVYDDGDGQSKHKYWIRGI